MRRLLPVCGLLSLFVAASAAAQSQRGVPRAIRSALTGCWHPWPGETWRVTPHGATGLRVSLRFDEAALRSRFRVRRVRPYRQALRYRPRTGRLQMGCGPTTQHGQRCVLRWDGRRLTVSRYALGHGPRRLRGRLVEVTEATRCRAR